MKRDMVSSVLSNSSSRIGQAIRDFEVWECGNGAIILVTYYLYSWGATLRLNKEVMLL